MKLIVTLEIKGFKQLCNSDWIEIDGGSVPYLIDAKNILKFEVLEL